MKKKLFPIDIDELKAISSKNHFHEKRPIRCTVIVIAFLFLLVALAVCFFREDLFTVNQMTFLEKLNQCILSNDKTGMERLLKYRKDRYDIVPRKSSVISFS